MCLCMCVYTYIHVIDAPSELRPIGWSNTGKSLIYIIYACMYVFVCIYTYIHMSIHTQYIYIYIYIHTLDIHRSSCFYGCRHAIPQHMYIHTQHTHTHTHWTYTGQVAFMDVVMRYRADLEPALRGVTFSTSPGEKVGVCMPALIFIYTRVCRYTSMHVYMCVCMCGHAVSALIL
jgi:hypothetical protein